MIRIESSSLKAFESAVSRYAAIRKKSFAYAALRGIRSTLYNAMTHLPKANKSMLQALGSSYRVRSWVLTRVAKGIIRAFRIAPGKRGLYPRAQAGKLMRRVIRIRAAHIGWRPAFFVRAIKWISDQLRPYNETKIPAKLSPRARKLAALSNQSKANESSAAVRITYTLRSALTAAAQPAGESTAQLNADFDRAISIGMAEAALDIQRYCDQHTARHA